MAILGRSAMVARAVRRRWMIALGMATTAALGMITTASAVTNGPRIVGGADVPNGAYPFVTALQAPTGPGGDGTRDFQTYCGASLVAPDWVLTAAHCVAAGQAPGLSTIRVIVGRTTLSSGNGEVRRAVSAHIDPQWSAASNESDVALIRLDSPVTEIAPVPISRRGDRSKEQPGTSALALGWGSTLAEPVNGGIVPSYPDTLQQVLLPIWTDADCTRVFDGVGNPTVDPAVEMCAGGDGQHDACTGDAGGPLIVGSGGAWTQIGIASWGSAARLKASRVSIRGCPNPA